MCFCKPIDIYCRNGEYHEIRSIRLFWLVFRTGVPMVAKAATLLWAPSECLRFTGPRVEI
jgi:hypothetical protein